VLTGFPCEASEVSTRPYGVIVAHRGSQGETHPTGSALHHVSGITLSVGLLWPRLTSVYLSHRVTAMAAMLSTLYVYLQAIGLKGLGHPVSAGIEQRLPSHDRQISPDKNTNCNCTTSAFTSESEPWALVCGATLPDQSALYAVSVRRLTVLRSGFLPTVGRPSAVAFG